MLKHSTDERKVTCSTSVNYNSIFSRYFPTIPSYDHRTPLPKYSRTNLLRLTSCSISFSYLIMLYNSYLIMLTLFRALFQALFRAANAFKTINTDKASRKEVHFAARLFELKLFKFNHYNTNRIFKIL